jgi:hypothetical protein
MKIEVTEKVIQRMIARSKRNFVRSGYFSPEVTRIVKNLRILIVFNKKLKTAAGQANALTYNQAIREFKVDKRYKSYIVDQRKKYLIIEINQAMAQRDAKEEVFDTVSHEVAHCVDFVIRGYKFVSSGAARKRYHDEFWREIHLAMGGSGKTTYEL